MWHARRRIDALPAMLGSISLIAWSVLGLHGSGLALPTFCSPETLGAIPLSVSFDLALLLNSPSQLAAGWALMITAMMSPLLIEPLRHVRKSSFAKRRGQAMLLFAAGYMAVWMAAGLALQPAALAARWAEPSPLACFICAAAIALLWQASPAKRWCLSRCHRQPHLAAFGAAAYRDVFGYGLVNGAACVGACWALMVLPLLLVQAHLVAMVAVTLFILAERLESPAALAWCWRGLSRALGIITQAHTIGLRRALLVRFAMKRTRQTRK
ncbi:putative metal-binding membrane protein [Bradyrhizobium diazoefficiens]